MLPDGKSNQPATLVISLDFELHWGVRDLKTVAQYRDNLLGVRRVVPALLKTFSDYGVHATWATVGFLFSSTRAELLDSLPDCRPEYNDLRLSPYLDLESLGYGEEDDPYHFGRQLIEQIRSSPGQEIATHTFSHFYCLEPRQSVAAFRSDLRAAFAAARKLSVDLTSIVFPRNQYDDQHLDACVDMGLKAFRGNQHSWIYQPRSSQQETVLHRSVRLLDSYWNLSSHNCYSLADVRQGPLINLPASRFLRPYVRNAPLLQKLQERRVVGDITYAAHHGLVYHLWWHPHNFGVRLEQNMGTLHRILDHFQAMREGYGMRSRSMAELTCEILNSDAPHYDDHQEHSFVR